MEIKVYKVKTHKRFKEPFRSVDYNQDFELEPEGIIDLEIFLRKRHLSLYCLDFDKKLAAFVETSNNIDLTKAPFYHHSQYEHAKRVHLMPFEAFLSFNFGDIKTKENILIYSVGRCGSTLLSKIFQNISGACSISEPDVYNQIHLLKRKKAIDECEARRLIKSSTMFLWRSIELETIKIVVIKFKSEVIKIHHDISSALPNSKTIFIYRNAVDVIQSYDRILGYPYTKKRWLLWLPGLPWLYKARMKLYYSRNPGLFDQYNVFIKNGSPYDFFSNLGHCGLFLLEWLSKVNSYLELRKYESDIIALRYEDLITNPREMIKVILNYCSISTNETENAYKALKMDAHTGTNLTRNPAPKYKLDKKDHIAIRNAIKRYTEFACPEVVLPGTISINQLEEEGHG